MYIEQNWFVKEVTLWQAVEKIDSLSSLELVKTGGEDWLGSQTQTWFLT